MEIHLYTFLYLQVVVTNLTITQRRPSNPYLDSFIIYLSQLHYDPNIASDLVRCSAYEGYADPETSYQVGLHCERPMRARYVIFESIADSLYLCEVEVYSIFV